MLGAESPLLRPSCLNAEPRSSARILSPSFFASERRVRTIMPHPSPRTKPLAEASKVLQRPSAAIMPAWEKLMVKSGDRIAFTPPFSAKLQFPLLRLWQARSTDTRHDKQAVSTTRLGPRKSKKYDNRLGMILFKTPVAARVGALRSSL